MLPIIMCYGNIEQKYYRYGAIHQFQKPRKITNTCYVAQTYKNLDTIK